MKKLVLTMIALVAMTTTSFAQYFTVYQPINSGNVDYSPRYFTPDYSYLNQLSSYISDNSYLNQLSTYTPVVSSQVVSSSTHLTPHPGGVNYNTTFVDSYTRSDGTSVQSHVRTMPNSTNWDNFSTKGNTNPYTGSTGYRAKDYSSDALNYGTGHTIYTGSRGGQYYYNSNGNKTYVPKR